MIYTVIDSETDSLDATLIYCLSYAIYDNRELLEKGTLINYSDMKEFLLKQETLVGHNIIRFDIPIFERILNISISAKLWDTLAISQYLYPILEFVHKLEEWGKRLKIQKIQIKDWKNLSQEKYVERCEVDVEINSKLFHFFMKYLSNLYNNDINRIQSVLNYLSFKFKCLLEQKTIGITLDVRLIEKTKYILEYKISEKEEALKKAMPKILLATAPKIMYKKDGSLSVHGENWKNRIKSLGLPENTLEIYKDGNPNSSDQVKKWLFSLGWIPQTYETSKVTGKEVPKVSLPFGAGICHSVKKLYPIEPNLKNLEEFKLLKHRLSNYIEPFLKLKDKNNKLYATAHAFTNTLRLRHMSPLVNLPKKTKLFGEQVRGCLTVPNENYIMCGSDLSQVEDKTKRHYIYPYDPEYVEEMNAPGFDSHIDIGKRAKMISEDEEKFYKWFKKQ